MGWPRRSVGGCVAARLSLWRTWFGPMEFRCVAGFQSKYSKVSNSMPASPALAYPTKGGRSLAATPGADPGGQLCVPSTLSRRGAPRTVTPNEPVVPHGPTHQDPRSHRPGQPGTVQRPGRAQRHHQPYRPHLGISPGNLYYHYPNKQAIIAELFAEYESHVESFLRLPEGRGLTVDDKTFYLEALLAAMWRYRSSTATSSTCWKATRAGGALSRLRPALPGQRQGDLPGFTEAGILRMNETQLEALTNAWIILTSLGAFLCTTLDLDGDLSDGTICVAASTRCWRWRAGTSRRAGPGCGGRDFRAALRRRSDPAGFLQHLLDVDAVASEAAHEKRRETR